MLDNLGPIQEIRRWSKAEDESLAEMIKAGVGCEEVAASLTKKYGIYRSKNSVIGRSHRIGVIPSLCSKNKSVIVRRKIDRPTMKPFSFGKGRGKKDSGKKVAAWSPKIEQSDVPISRRVGLADKPETQCCWSYGHPGEAGYHFCHRLKVKGLSWCPEHSEKAKAK